MKQLSHIGTVEKVSLLNDAIRDVPAKIDTGADSSAIWGTVISEESNTLRFTLFDRGSAFYTGEVLETTEYEVISVKNSFGQSEFRYKLPLKIKIAGRTIRAKFTLANRAKNRYPVLIGRRTIQGKFLVDVTIKPTELVRQVLMLSTKRTDVTARFAANVDKASKSLRVTYAAYEDLWYEFGPDGATVRLREGGQDLAEFDLIHFKTTSRYADIAAATAHYAEQHHVAYIDKASRDYPGTSKLYQYMLLETEELTVPNSIFAFPAVLQQSYDELAAKLGVPFILKDIHGNKGEHNYLVRDKKSFTAACATAKKAGVQCIAQQYIENDGDYRVLVFGIKIGLVIYRTAQNASHLNNTSQGAKAEIVPASALPPQLQKACSAAARRVGRQVAGVDIVKDKVSGLWYCLEVNDGPQIASGSFKTEKYKAFAAYLERRLHS